MQRLRSLPDQSVTISPRGREVAEAVLRGLTDKQIARELCVSVSTVRTYLVRLFEKTGVSRRSGLAQCLIAQPGSDD